MLGVRLSVGDEVGLDVVGLDVVGVEVGLNDVRLEVVCDDVGLEVVEDDFGLYMVGDDIGRDNVGLDAVGDEVGLKDVVNDDGLEVVGLNVVDDKVGQHVLHLLSHATLQLSLTTLPFLSSVHTRSCLFVFVMHPQVRETFLSIKTCRLDRPDSTLNVPIKINHEFTM